MVAARVLFVVAAWIFVALPHNPIVRLEAVLGLSPSPLEKLIGIRGPFSGMTEGAYRLAHGQVVASVEANPLTPVVVAIFLVCALSGSRPRIRNRRHEAAFFLVMCIGTVLVNLRR